MTLTLSPEIEQALTEAAVETGKTPDELAEETLRVKFVKVSETPQERKTRIYSLMGSMAYLGPSHILADRVEDLAREERR